MIYKILKWLWIFILLAGGCVSPPASLDLTSPTLQSTPSLSPLSKIISPTEIIQTITPDTVVLEFSTEQTDKSVFPTLTITPPFFTSCDQSVCYTPFKGILNLPVPPGDNQTVEPSYRYGTTQNGERIPHDGVEFYTPYGSPVLAAENGVIIYAGDDRTQTWGRFTNFYGNLIVIEHQLAEMPQPVYTLYAHLSNILVKSGDTVRVGQKIGEVGASGSAIGSHLHFEVRLNQPDLQNTQNPELFLDLIHDPNQKTGILVGRVLSNSNSQTSQILVIQKIKNNSIQTNETLYLETYAANIPSNSELGENFVISNLPTGEYRITTFINERLFENYFFIKENTLTDISLSMEEK